jgi:hypothetical protein
MHCKCFLGTPRAAIFAALIACVAGGCAVVDDVTPRTAVMNLSMADYNNYSMLLNIVRASQHEPLLFVSVTQASPNLSFGANVAAPSLAFNPYHLATNTISGNTATATASDAIEIQPLDDPSSWQAMLTPVDAATIGFFGKQSYPHELLFFMFIDHLRKETGPNTYVEYTNDPTNRDDFKQFAISLEALIRRGLTIQVERGASKSGPNPASRICFEVAEALRVRRFERSRPTSPVERIPSQDKCGAWLLGQTTDATGPQGKAPAGAKNPLPEAWYALPQIDGEKWLFTTRSPYAVYQIMGRWLEMYQKSQGQDPRQKEETLRGLSLLLTDGEDKLPVRIEESRTTACFVSLTYKGQYYCVPEEARLTKTAFSILHQVAGLNIAHAQTPGTVNVRSVQ